MFCGWESVDRPLVNFAQSICVASGLGDLQANERKATALHVSSLGAAIATWVLATSHYFNALLTT